MSITLKDTNIIYRASSTPNAAIDGRKKAIGLPLTNAQIDGNFASLQEAIDSHKDALVVFAYKENDTITGATLVNSGTSGTINLKETVNIGTDNTKINIITIGNVAPSNGSSLTIIGPVITNPTITGGFTLNVAGDNTPRIYANSTSLSIINTPDNNITLNSTNAVVKSQDLYISGSIINIGSVQNIAGISRVDTTSINIGTIGSPIVTIGNFGSQNLNIIMPNISNAKLTNSTIYGTMVFGSTNGVLATLGSNASLAISPTDYINGTTQIATTDYVIKFAQSIAASEETPLDLNASTSGTIGTSLKFARADHRHPTNGKIVDLINNDAIDNNAFIVWNSGTSKWAPVSYSSINGSFGQNGTVSGKGGTSSSTNILGLGTAAFESANSFSLIGHTHDTNYLGRPRVTNVAVTALVNITDACTITPNLDTTDTLIVSVNGAINSTYKIRLKNIISTNTPYDGQIFTIKLRRIAGVSYTMNYESPVKYKMPVLNSSNYTSLVVFTTPPIIPYSYVMFKFEYNSIDDLWVLIDFCTYA